MKYRAAVVGLGRIGFGFNTDPRRKYVATHTGAYRFVEGTELTAVCDLNSKLLKECTKKLNVPGYTGVSGMLRKERIDILSICTQSQNHYPVLKEAVKFPLKAVFCEKPLADNPKTAAKMVKLCRDRKIILQVGHQRRFDQLHLELHQAIRKARWGKTQQVNFYYTAGVNNTGSHMFDVLRFFFGDVKWVEGFFSENISHKKEDPNIDGILKFKNGVFATFQTCNVKKYLIFEMDCFFEKARLVLKDSGFSVDLYGIEKSKYYSGYKELRKTAVPFQTDYKRNFMVNAVNHLVDCIKSKKESISSGRDGLRALELIETSLVSAKNDGKRIYLEERRK